MKTLLFTLLMAATSFAEDSASCASVDKTQDSLLGAIRTINAAEVTYRMQNSQPGRFASLDDLISSGAIKRYFEESSRLPPGTAILQPSGDPLPGFQLKLLISADGQHYMVSALKVEGECHGVGLYSSDSGVIYRAKALD